MNDFPRVKVGTVLTRVYTLGSGQEDRTDAEVVEITDSAILCDVLVDQMRKMEFDRATGISTEGKEFGHLEFKN